jgi:hypothetical protein
MLGQFGTTAPRFSADASAAAVPGPGAYSPPSHLLASHAPRFGSNARFAKVSATLTPGPGAYSTASHLGFTSPGSAAFGSRAERALSTSQSDTPGPGEYDSQMSSTNGSDLGACWPSNARLRDGHRDRRKAAQPRDWQGNPVHAPETPPGPGAYETASGAAPRRYGRNVAFGSSFDLLGSRTAPTRSPGPGSYRPAVKRRGNSERWDQRSLPLGANRRPPFGASNPRSGTRVPSVLPVDAARVLHYLATCGAVAGTPVHSQLEQDTYSASLNAR